MENTKINDNLIINNYKLINNTYKCKYLDNLNNFYNFISNIIENKNKYLKMILKI